MLESKLFHSVIDESKEEYLKKLCFILLSGRLVTFL